MFIVNWRLIIVEYVYYGKVMLVDGVSLILVVRL